MNIELTNLIKTGILSLKSLTEKEKTRLKIIFFCLHVMAIIVTFKTSCVVEDVGDRIKYTFLSFGLFYAIVMWMSNKPPKKNNTNIINENQSSKANWIHAAIILIVNILFIITGTFKLAWEVSPFYGIAMEALLIYGMVINILTRRYKIKL